MRYNSWMVKLDKSHVEVVRDGKWHLMPVETAVGMKAGVRCSSCKQLGKVHRASVNGMRAHFEHYEANPECELSYRSQASKANR